MFLLLPWMPRTGLQQKTVRKASLYGGACCEWDAPAICRFDLATGAEQTSSTSGPSGDPSGLAELQSLQSPGGGLIACQEDTLELLFPLASALLTRFLSSASCSLDCPPPAELKRGRGGVTSASLARRSATSCSLSQQLTSYQGKTTTV